MSFWDVVWFIVISFAFIAYLLVLFQIIGDLFRDPDESGVKKALWLVMLIVLPLLTSLAYLIIRGPKMAQRQGAAMAEAQSRQEAYIRDVAGQGASPTAEIAKAAELRDQGQITEAEFHQIKERALSS